jgi:hypothetical protein
MKKLLLDEMQAGIFLSFNKSRHQRPIGAVQKPDNQTERSNAFRAS